jgi:hypothetical protein
MAPSGPARQTTAPAASTSGAIPSASNSGRDSNGTEGFIWDTVSEAVRADHQRTMGPESERRVNGPSHGPGPNHYPSGMPMCILPFGFPTPGP